MNRPVPMYLWSCPFHRGLDIADKVTREVNTIPTLTAIHSGEAGNSELSFYLHRGDISCFPTRRLQESAIYVSGAKPRIGRLH